MSSLSAAEAGKASDRKPGLSPSTMESARRFLYDEDVPSPAGNVAPIPSAKKTSFSTGNNRKRLNPIVAACLATTTACRSCGNNRLFYVLSAIIGIAFFSFGIHSWSSSGDTKVDAERLHSLQSKIIENGLTSEVDITKPGSSQYHALQWLCSYDDSKIDAEDEYMISRYIMAVLFYSLSSADKNDVKPASGWKDQTGWMTSAGYCSWKGVRCIDGDLTNGKIKSITLDGNGLTGTLPTELTGLDYLMIISLKNNQIGGTLPTELAQIKDLRFLLLQDNAIRGTLPTEFGAFQSIRDLDLGKNDLGGSIPPLLEKSFTMKRLRLNNNNFEGTIPELDGFGNLAELNLQNNKLKGNLPSSFAKLTSLVDLKLSNNTLTGSIPDNFDKLTKLGT